MNSGIWISTTVQILGLVIALITIGGTLFAVGKFAERASNGITLELKHMNLSIDGLREDLQALVQTVNNHSERLARIEGWRDRQAPPQ